jgi:hypothetical protein
MARSEGYRHWMCRRSRSSWRSGRSCLDELNAFDRSEKGVLRRVLCARIFVAALIAAGLLALVLN